VILKITDMDSSNDGQIQPIKLELLLLKYRHRSFRMTYKQNVPTTFCYSTSTEKYYSMFEYHCGYLGDACQYFQDPFAGAHL
jgi:hypothetical protein